MDDSMMMLYSWLTMTSCKGSACWLACQDCRRLTAAVCSPSAAASVAPVAMLHRRSSPAWLPNASSPAGLGAPTKQALLSRPSRLSSRNVRASLRQPRCAT